jgi:hypothetical protein
MDTTMEQLDLSIAEQHLAKATIPMNYFDTLPEQHKEMFKIYLADTEVCQPTKEVDKTMFNECCDAAPRVKTRMAIANAQVIGNTPVEATQRDYTTERVKAIADKHSKTLHEQFHMDSDRPRTAAELIAAIKNDQFTLNTELLKTRADEIKRGYYNNEYGINWGPSPDIDGYNAATEALKAAAQKALDGATLKSLDALEGVINDFEAWVYTPAQ